MNSNQETVLHLKNISKSFPGVKALRNVNLEVYKGEVHALVGENGAGKSTLLNVMKGIYGADEGEIIYEGQPITIKNPGHASKIGINMVHQELNLVPELTVGQNILLGNEPLKAGIINYSELYARCEEILIELGCTFSSDEKVGNLSVANMQMVAIGRCLMHNSKVVALDEPTASLSDTEIEHLFTIIKKLKEAGTAIIYVSHRLDELFGIADRVTVFRDGMHVATKDISEVTRDSLVELMVGRSVSEYMAHSNNYSVEEEVLRVEHLTSKGKFEDINFKLKKGEILGFSGLVGAGRTEVMRVIFGADKYDSGEIYLHNKKLDIKDCGSAIKSGIALIPEERKAQGFIKGQSNAVNINVSILDKYIKAGAINYKKLYGNTEHYIEKLKIVPPNPHAHTDTMSGGNQQKVVLAKWMSANSEVMIYDEPTRGIDIGAKSEIYRLMDDFVKNGGSIIMVSSELPEILGMCDRIVVMHEGRITGELDGKDATEVNVLHYAMGGDQ